MKPRGLLLAVLLLSVPLAAQPLAIFSRTDARPAAVPAPADGPARSFFQAYTAARAAQAGYPARLPLINPPAWGKTIRPATGGVVNYLPRFLHGFVCHIRLHDLAPNHAYILCLNGNPEKAGNLRLPTPVPGNEAEKYYDFRDITSDAHGAFDGEFGIFLPPGDYELRLYVKDAADFKIVLYRDFFPFQVD